MNLVARVVVGWERMSLLGGQGTWHAFCDGVFHLTEISSESLRQRRCFLTDHRCSNTDDETCKIQRHALISGD